MRGFVLMGVVDQRLPDRGEVERGAWRLRRNRRLHGGSVLRHRIKVHPGRRVVVEPVSGGARHPERAVAHVALEVLERAKFANRIGFATGPCGLGDGCGSDDRRDTG